MHSNSLAAPRRNAIEYRQGRCACSSQCGSSGVSAWRGIFGLGKEGGGVLLHQVVQRGLFWTVALVVDSNCELQTLAPEPDGREHPQMAGRRQP